MEKEMRLKKNLYAVVMFLAVASMVLPSVRAGGLPTPKKFMKDPNFAENYRSQLLQHQNNPKAYTSKGNQKPLANNGLLQTGPTLLDRARSVELQSQSLLKDTPDNLIQRHNNSGKAATIDPSVYEAAYNPQPVQLTAAVGPWAGGGYICSVALTGSS
jgi:hypothetical protein